MASKKKELVNFITKSTATDIINMLQYTQIAKGEPNFHQILARYITKNKPIT